MGKPTPLKNAMRKEPVFFEAIPPPRRASATSIEDSLARLEGALKAVPRLSAVNIPEIVDENHLGIPLYRTHEPRSFGDMLRERMDVEVAVNKVVVHMASRGDLLTWARTSILSHNVHNFVLVGGISHIRQYPGPSVVESCGILSNLFRNLEVEEGVMGCVTIPSRGSEPERLFAKTLAGARFATTQILFGVTGVTEFLSGYSALCAEFGVEPATIFLSFAPLQDAHDVELSRWLGAEVPEEVEERILTNGEEAVEFSKRTAVQIYKELKGFASQTQPRIPLGINVEQVSHHNLQAAVSLARHLSME